MESRSNPVKVAIVADWLYRRGGAERVVLSLLRAFPDAEVYTSLYRPGATFPEFATKRIHTMALDRIKLLHRWHHLALPLLAPCFGRTYIDADIVLAVSAGWAHGARTRGRRIVYCQTPARWLYQPAGRYLGRAVARRSILGALRRPLQRWDQAAAGSAARYLVNSTDVQERVRRIYGIEAEVVTPPSNLNSAGRQESMTGLPAAFHLCVGRLVPYKNVAAVIEAFRQLPGRTLVVVTTGRVARATSATLPANVTLRRDVTDAQLRWLYDKCDALVTALYEDFGLTVIEAASFGKPAVAMRWGGFLDTVVEGVTGILFDRPEPDLIRSGIEGQLGRDWDAEVIRRHAEQFSEERFVERIRDIVSRES